MSSVGCQCRVCGKNFVARRRSAKYCSEACKSQYQRDKRSGRIKGYDGMDALTKARLRFISKVSPGAAALAHDEIKLNGRSCGEAVINACFMAVTAAMNTTDDELARLLHNYSYGVNIGLGLSE